MLAFSAKASAQETPSKEEFLNEISEQMLENHKFFNLCNETLKINFSLYQINHIDKALHRGLDPEYEFKKIRLTTIDSVLLELKEIMVSDTTVEVWHCGQLNKAVCVDSVGEKEILAKANGDWIVGDWSDEEIKNLQVKHPYRIYLSTRWIKQKSDSVYNARIAKREKLPYEVKAVYRVSKPFFSRDKTYALIIKEGSLGKIMPGGGSAWLYKKIGGRWNKIFETSSWAH